VTRERNITFVTEELPTFSIKTFNLKIYSISILSGRGP